MDVKVFTEIIGADFYTGVPDSKLRPLCDYLMDRYGEDGIHHVIAANEGNCAALAAGYHLATGKIPVVYMQNSGEGNIVNPAASLLNREVYAIPVVFIIGWRGEPGVPDEPQHTCQGRITKKLLDVLDIQAFEVGRNSTEAEVRDTRKKMQEGIAKGKQAAFVIRKDGLSYKKSIQYTNNFSMVREIAIRQILDASGTDPVVCTTGKASRELFEERKRRGQGHWYDFLTVGSMGHSSSIALGIALQKPEATVWCIDGDGAMLMHMGALAVIGRYLPGNLVHVVINNSAHESVGGMPTAAGSMDITAAAKACGYSYVASASSYEELGAVLKEVKTQKKPCMIEVKCMLGAREDLGRPTTSALENKREFMEYLAGLA